MAQLLRRSLKPFRPLGVRCYKIDPETNTKPPIPRSLLVERQTQTAEEMMKEHLMYRQNGTHEGGSQSEKGFHGYDVWRKVTAFIGIPVFLYGLYNGYVFEVEHLKHTEEHGRLPFKPYAHLKKHSSEMPWGGYKTLFHNPKTNWLYDGYEDEAKE